ncbi:MAG TPA: phosphoribosyltransferase family protein [Candidatus Acidoferrum sp.]|nr:phosphoribosyltransferase family protein [Candidatus Acidoferrum sp.]
MRRGRGGKDNTNRGSVFSPARIATRVAELGRQISRACGGKRLDVVITLDRGFVFGADLIRHIDAPTVCHFVREEVRDVDQGGHLRREVAFGSGPDVKGRDVLLVDAVLDSGVTQEFLLRRLGESQPRSLRLAVLLDKPEQRRVGLEPDYFGFRTASNGLWVGYGLAASNGMGRNEKGLSMKPLAGRRRGRNR